MPKIHNITSNNYQANAGKFHKAARVYINHHKITLKGDIDTVAAEINSHADLTGVYASVKSKDSKRVIVLHSTRGKATLSDPSGILKKYGHRTFKTSSSQYSGAVSRAKVSIGQNYGASSITYPVNPEYRKGGVQEQDQLLVDNLTKDVTELREELKNTKRAQDETGQDLQKVKETNLTLSKEKEKIALDLLKEQDRANAEARQLRTLCRNTKIELRDLEKQFNNKKKTLNKTNRKLTKVKKELVTKEEYNKQLSLELLREGDAKKQLQKHNEELNATLTVQAKDVQEAKANVENMSNFTNLQIQSFSKQATEVEGKLRHTLAALVDKYKEKVKDVKKRIGDKLDVNNFIKSILKQDYDSIIKSHEAHDLNKYIEKLTYFEKDLQDITSSAKMPSWIAKCRLKKVAGVVNVDCTKMISYNNYFDGLYASSFGEVGSLNVDDNKNIFLVAKALAVLSAVSTLHDDLINYNSDYYQIQHWLAIVMKSTIEYIKNDTDSPIAAMQGKFREWGQKVYTTHKKSFMDKILGRNEATDSLDSFCKKIQEATSKLEVKKAQPRSFQGTMPQKHVSSLSTYGAGAGAPQISKLR